VRKSHLYLLAFAARLLEGFGIGQCTDTIAYIFVEVAGNFARDRRRALRFQAARAVALAGPVINDVALVDIACAGQFRSAWVNIDIAILVEDEVGTAECAIRGVSICPKPARAV
jgi:hypothetical protein